MSTNRLLLLTALPLLAAPANAQLLQPATTLRASPRASWVSVTATGTPTQRRDNPGAASNDRMYVFGGRDGNANSTVHNALYEFDGSTWTLKTPDTAAAGFPLPRGGACVAWNFSTNKLVVFGGDTGTGPVGGSAVTTALLNDTWEWDPITNSWTDVTPVAGSPSPRRAAAMTWDPTLGGMVMFGGDTALTPTTPNAETWLFVAGSWVLMAPATSPPARVNHSLVTRTAPYNDVLLCCGIDESLTLTTDRLRYLDVWTWNGLTWTKISDWDFVTQTGSHPASSVANQAVYDQLRQKVVVQGGNGLSVGTFTSSTATGTPTNTTYIYGWFNTGTAQWEQYNGSPTNWTSEFDCTTSTWTIFSRKLAVPALATWSEADPVIGRTGRYFGAYVPALGRIYKVSGQNPSGTGTTTLACAYQATPVASTLASVPLCTGGGGLITLTADNLPWLGSTFQLTASNMAAVSYNLGYIGFTPLSVPINAVLPQGIPGCLVLQSLDLEFFVSIGASGTWPIAIPTTAALAGLSGSLQVASAEFDAFLNLTAVGSSNSVTVTLGVRD